MATLTSQQLKDSYQSLVTIGDSITSNPTSGQLENGLGNPITALGIGTDSPLNAVHIESSISQKALFTNTDFVNGSAGTSLDINFGATSGNTYAEIRSLINGRSAWGDFLLARGGGNVGIGINPSYKLDVNSGGANVVANFASTDAFAQIYLADNSTTNAEVIRRAGDVTSLYSGGNNALTIDSSANVGIGQTSPTNYTNGTTLEIKGKTGTGAGLLKVTNANGTTSGALYASSSSIILNAQTNHDLVFHTNNTIKMLIKSSGNVGIGATSVTAVGSRKTLHIDDSSGSAIRLSESSTNLAFLSYDSTSFFRLSSSDQISFLTAGNERLRIDSSGNVGFNATPENSAGTWRNFNFGSLSMAGRANNANPDAMFGTNFKFTTANAEQRISAHATSRIFFNDDVTTFQNAGSGTAGSAISWNPNMTIDSSGTVIVGATSESNWETVAGFRTRQSGSTTITRDGNPPLYLNRITSDGGILEFRKGSTTVGSIASVATGKIGFFGSGGTGAVIDSSGRVGIGTVSPNSNHKAHIEAGSGNNTSLLVTTTDNADTAQVIIGHDEGLQGGLQLISDKTNSIAKIRVTNSSLFPLSFQVRGSDGTNERMRILPTGGITFNGDTAQANALDDYEEGTHDPTLSDGTYTASIGTAKLAYTKVGNMVTITGFFYVNSYDASASASRISLPFAIADLSNSAGDFAGTVRARKLNTSNTHHVIAYGDEGNGYVLLQEIVDNADPVDIGGGAYQNGTTITLNFSYFTS